MSLDCVIRGQKIKTFNEMEVDRLKRGRHRWGAKVRRGLMLSISTCEKCGLVMHSRHSVDPDGVLDHWKEYYTADHPDVEIRTMPECDAHG